MQRNLWRFGNICLALGVLTALAACQSDDQPRPTTQRANNPPPRIGPVRVPPTPVAQAPVVPIRTGPLRIALLAPLSGDFSDAGRDLANGAAMALLDAPAAAAEILTFDTAGDAAMTEVAFQKAVDSQADIIVGPLFGKNAQAITGLLESSDLSALSFSNDGSAAGGRLMIMGRAVQWETARIVRHAASAGALTIAVFGKADAIGNAAADQAEQDAFSAPGGINVRRALYAADTDYTAIARKVQSLLHSRGRNTARSTNAEALKAQLDGSQDPGAELARLSTTRLGTEGAVFRELATFYARMVAAGTQRPSAVNAVVNRYRTLGGLGSSGVDAVLLTIGGVELSTIAPMFQLYDAQASGVRLLGLSSWNDIDPTRARELHGGRFASEPYSDAFDARYEGAFAAESSELAAVAYDAVKLALAAHQISNSRPIPTAALVAAGQIDGATGSVRMSESGISLRPLEVLEMRPDGVFPIDPAKIVDPAEPVTPSVSAGS
jgi:ABC-type branched-subunit amino acid transport system substrate-binding protein